MAFIKNIIIIIVSIAIGFFATYIIAGINSEIASSSIPFLLWGIFTIISAFSLRSIFNGKRKIGKSTWKPPEQIRDQVINTPQFVGRFDRAKGLLEATARMVAIDLVDKPSYWSQSGVNYQVISLRGELLDQDGNTLEHIPVQIKAKRSDWVGTIAGGDRIRVEGKVGSDGILHADWAFNFSTNSRVGKPN